MTTNLTPKRYAALSLNCCCLKADRRAGKVEMLLRGSNLQRMDELTAGVGTEQHLCADMPLLELNKLS